MNQVPADRVITELVSKLGELTRENAILKVQVAMYQEAETVTPSGTPPVPDVTGA